MSQDTERLIFISYSRTDKDFALELAMELRASGFSVWLDQLDIPTGARWDDAIERALKQCEIFMVILTPHSITSDNVKDEIGYAIDSNKRILPVLLENANLPLRLRRLQYVNFTAVSYNEGIELAKQLLKKLMDESQDTDLFATGTEKDPNLDEQLRIDANHLARQRAEAMQRAREREQAQRYPQVATQASLYPNQMSIPQTGTQMNPAASRTPVVANPPVRQPNYDNEARIALVLGAVSIATSFCFGIFAMFPAAITLFFGFRGLKSARPLEAVGGLMLSGVAILIGIFMVLLSLASLASY